MAATLTSWLEAELVAAVRAGDGVAGVMREWGLTRGRYYRRVAIGRGALVTWPDGCPIDEGDIERCRRLVDLIARARMERFIRHPVNDDE